MITRSNSLYRKLALTLGVASLSILSACAEQADPVSPNGQTATEQTPVLPAADASATNTAVAPQAESQLVKDDMPSAVIGASEIPYPLYPNGSKYRVGGENGMKIVLFETVDSFEQVDSFFRSETSANGMPRLVAMSDYVRYSNTREDKDPWATFRPGIVIHQFKDDAERSALGADKSALTNIIMSF